MNLNKKLKCVTPERHTICQTHAVASDIQGFQKLMYDQTYKYSEIVFLQFQCVLIC